jgi:hypothetical protein
MFLDINTRKYSKLYVFKYSCDRRRIKRKTKKRTQNNWLSSAIAFSR